MSHEGVTVSSCCPTSSFRSTTKTLQEIHVSLKIDGTSPSVGYSRPCHSNCQGLHVSTVRPMEYTHSPIVCLLSYLGLKLSLLDSKIYSPIYLMVISQILGLQIVHFMSWYRHRRKWLFDSNPLEYLCSLQWRHNECDGVWNHQHHHCLLNCLFRPTSKKTSKLWVTGLCAGHSPVTGNQWTPCTVMSHFE